MSVVLFSVHVCHRKQQLTTTTTTAGEIEVTTLGTETPTPLEETQTTLTPSETTGGEGEDDAGPTEATTTTTMTGVILPDREVSSSTRKTSEWMPPTTTAVSPLKMPDEWKEERKRDRPRQHHRPAPHTPLPPRLQLFYGRPLPCRTVRVRRSRPGRPRRRRLGSRLQPDRSPLDTHMAPKVVNLSGCDLDDNELAVLEKGLTFIPQRFPRTATKLQTDFDAFARRLRIQYIFRDKTPLP